MKHQHLLQSSDELVSLLTATPVDVGTLTLCGREWPYRGVTVDEYFRQVVGRFESVKAFYVWSAAAAIAAQSGQQLPDTNDYLAAQFADAPDANRAFVACGLNQPGNPALEEALARADPDEFDAALAKIEFKTWGSDPARFLSRVGERAGGRPMSVVMAAQARKGGPKVGAGTTRKRSSTAPRTPSSASSRSRRK